MEQYVRRTLQRNVLVFANRNAKQAKQEPLKWVIGAVGDLHAIMDPCSFSTVLMSDHLTTYSIRFIKETSLKRKCTHLLYHNV